MAQTKSTCPLCYKSFKIEEIEHHAENCLGEESSTSNEKSESPFIPPDLPLLYPNQFTSPSSPLNTVPFVTTTTTTTTFNNTGTPTRSYRCQRNDCLSILAELEEYKIIFDQLLSYINLRDRVKLETIGDVKDHIKRSSLISNQCMVCKLVIDDGKNFERHLNECMDLVDNPQTKGQVKILRNITGRTKAEVLLVARHYNLLEPAERTEAARLLQEGIDIEKWKSLKKEIILKKECNICFETFTISEMFTLDCPSSHRFCRECMHGHLETDLGDKRVSFCPAQGCKHQISEMEVKQLFGNGSELETYTEILLQRELAKLPVVGCPTPGCKNFLEVRNPNVPVHCICSCGASFCSMCRHEYHFRTSCHEAMHLTAKWINWNQSGRDEYHKVLAKTEQHCQALLEAEKKKVKARNEELKQRYNDLVQDEQWKEQNCHACPHCGRPIQKLEGCDSMVCGSDYHGGNVQNGCGQRFSWGQSQPYKSQGLQGPTQEEVKIEKPVTTNRANHGEWRPCDGCHKTIVGLRFCCVHCASFNLCEMCEFKVEHEKGHVFKVIEKVEEEEKVQLEAGLSEKLGKFRKLFV